MTVKRAETTRNTLPEVRHDAPRGTTTTTEAQGIVASSAAGRAVVSLPLGAVSAGFTLEVLTNPPPPTSSFQNLAPTEQVARSEPSYSELGDVDFKGSRRLLEGLAPSKTPRRAKILKAWARAMRSMSPSQAAQPNSFVERVEEGAEKLIQSSHTTSAARPTKEQPAERTKRARRNDFRGLLRTTNTRAYVQAVLRKAYVISMSGLADLAHELEETNRRRKEVRKRMAAVRRVKSLGKPFDPQTLALDDETIAAWPRPIQKDEEEPASSEKTEESRSAGDAKSEEPAAFVPRVEDGFLTPTTSPSGKYKGLGTFFREMLQSISDEKKANVKSLAKTKGFTAPNVGNCWRMGGEVVTRLLAKETLNNPNALREIVASLTPQEFAYLCKILHEYAHAMGEDYVGHLGRVLEVASFEQIAEFVDHLGGTGGTGFILAKSQATRGGSNALADYQAFESWSPSVEPPLTGAALNGARTSEWYKRRGDVDNLEAKLAPHIAEMSGGEAVAFFRYAIADGVSTDVLSNLVRYLRPEIFAGQSLEDWSWLQDLGGFAEQIWTAWSDQAGERFASTMETQAGVEDRLRDEMPNTQAAQQQLAAQQPNAGGATLQAETHGPANLEGKTGHTDRDEENGEPGAANASADPVARGSEPESELLPADAKQLDAILATLKDELETADGDAQMQQLRLQDAMQKQQQTLTMLSNVAKVDHDTGMSIIRNIGG